MSRKFPKLSPEFEADHMAEQERIREVVDRRQAAQTKDYKAGKFRIARDQAKHDLREQT